VENSRRGEDVGATTSRKEKHDCKVHRPGEGKIREPSIKAAETGRGKDCISVIKRSKLESRGSCGRKWKYSDEKGGREPKPGPFVPRSTSKMKSRRVTMGVRGTGALRLNSLEREVKGLTRQKGLDMSHV